MAFTPTEILARCPLFAELDLHDLDALAAVATRHRFHASQSLFLEGDPPAGMHIVVHGRVEIAILSPETGREVVLSVEHPFNAVAELPTLDGDSYPANARAGEATETLFLDQEGFLRVLRERPDVSLHLLRTLGGRLRRLVELIERLSFQEVIHRLAAHLLRRAEVDLPFELETNASIAAQIGTVPELVSRNLARLHAAGAITLEKRHVTAVDLASLRGSAEAAGR